ncbi:unnamed protein product [Cuscuta epithymum]|uniref:Uncharacterized protein n=1 Tax=Cuscuta epithymum TaxID=186058 RepID=A0AAV0EV12_9ASTE|nr:unnamed protein product [Cuscuta epithymum]
MSNSNSWGLNLIIIIVLGGSFFLFSLSSHTFGRQYRLVMGWWPLRRSIQVQQIGFEQHGPWLFDKAVAPFLAATYLVVVKIENYQLFDLQIQCLFFFACGIHN